jgi:hypothetical protein
MLLFLLSIALFSFGCVSSKSYVDPAFGKVTYDSLPIPANPHKLSITAEFQRNGVHLPEVDSELYGHVERVLRASRFAVPAQDKSEGAIKVVVNNIADIEKAKSMGFGTGFTFGAAGSWITDYYEMNVEYVLGEKSFNKSGYKHQLHTTIGNKKGPEGVLPVTAAAGFADIVEDLLLNFLGDLYKEGS